MRRGATLGANCTIVCGGTIGRYAFLGAEAIVTRRPAGPFVHPRIRKGLPDFKTISEFSVNSVRGSSKLKIIAPVGYLDMLLLEQNARGILTDSGGIQKEAYFFGVPCITMRTETEWVETVEAGWNVVTGADREKIVEAVRSFKMGNPRPELYEDGRAAEKIVKVLCDNVSRRGAEL